MSFVDFIKSNEYFFSMKLIQEQFTDIMPGLFHIFWREKETQGNIICSYFLTAWRKITKTGQTSGLVSVH